MGNLLLQSTTAFLLVLNFKLTSAIYSTLGSDLECSSGGATLVSLSHSSFTMSVGDKGFSCNCRGTECEQITCIALEPVAPTDRRRNACRDRITGRYYARGVTFLRHTSAGINLSCKCPELGPLKISCTSTQCTIPPPITSSHVPSKVNGSCYDRYTNSWHPYETPYKRRVVMSYTPDILGFYTCRCTAFGTKCKADDIPCCDTKTGKFVPKNTRFSATINSAKVMSCVCLGGRGRIGNCQEPEPTAPETVPNNRQCYDRITRNIYSENEEFIRYKQDGDRHCECKRRRNKMQIRCSRRKSF